jgi:hypothetical protein
MDRPFIRVNHSYGNGIPTRSCQTSDFFEKSDVWLQLNHLGQTPEWMFCFQAIFRGPT